MSEAPQADVEDDLTRASLDARLPRKRCSAGFLLRDREGRILLVKPTYRREWMIPGGVVEGSETPAAAAAREVLEETGLHVRLSGLLCVDLVPPHAGFSESVHFLFAGTVDGDDDVPARPDESEIVRVEFFEPARATALLPPQTGRRLAAVLAGHTGYFERGAPLLPVAPLGDLPIDSAPDPERTP